MMTLVTTTEPIDWQDHLFAAYARDAEAIIKRVFAGGIDRPFVERILELLRTYTEIPDVGIKRQDADEAIVRMVHTAIGYIPHFTRWGVLTELLPKLIAMTEQIGDIELYINFMKFFMIAKGRHGNANECLAIYQELIQHPFFEAASSASQADILCQAGTMLLWGGQPQAARSILENSLALTHTMQALSKDNVRVTLGLSINIGVTPLWETHAYTLNQLGVFHMFRGEFAQARYHFDEMQAIFVTRGEENNLACVTWQAIGRLLLYAGKYGEALSMLEEGGAIRAHRGEQEGVAINSIYIAAAQIRLGQFEEARVLLTQACTVCLEQENFRDLALCHLYLGEVACCQSQIEKACDQWRQTIDLATYVVLHFVELRLWLRYVPRLLRQKQFTLTWRLCQTLWHSIEHDQLSLGALWRFLWISVKPNMGRSCLWNTALRPFKDE